MKTENRLTDSYSTIVFAYLAIVSGSIVNLLWFCVETFGSNILKEATDEDEDSSEKSFEFFLSILKS